MVTIASHPSPLNPKREEGKKKKNPGQTRRNRQQHKKSRSFSKFLEVEPIDDISSFKHRSRVQFSLFFFRTKGELCFLEPNPSKKIF